MAEEQSTGKSFFHTLPGIITAIAGLITAIGGFILILNQSGCFKSKAENLEQHISSDSSANNNNVENKKDKKAIQDSSSDKGNVSYTPATIKHLTRYLVYTIEEASTETLPNGAIVLNVKLKCVNNSDYEYPFYATYLGVRIHGERYSPEPYSPSGGYVAVPARHLKELEYNFKLPRNIKNFELVFYDLEEEIGSSTFTLK